MLYAETHYTFRYLGSLLKLREPEILADAPLRIEPDTRLPVLCVIKDAHRFPVQLNQISLKALYASGRLDEHPFPFHAHVAQPLWHTVLDFAPREQGPVTVDVAFHVRTGGRERLIRNDNYRTASHAPLRVLVSPESLPRAPGWFYGEPHCHTIYSNDQVEFGAPVGATVTLAQAMGLDWLAVTDHSYDLDDLPDSPLARDPDLTLWHRMQGDVEQANQAHPGFVALAGEEVSCRNGRARNVHLLALGTRRFIEGSGDSAERWFSTRSECTAPEVIEEVHRDGGVAYAAHPSEPTPFLEWLLIRRGRWGPRDLAHPLLSGLQIWNGEHSRGFQAGRHEWVRLLLAGHKKHILAGNDAHGNFNRFRQIGVPFVSIRESNRQVLGRVRTGLFLGERPTQQTVLAALRHGSSIVTDGPFLALSLKGGRDPGTAIGRTLDGHASPLRIEGRTTQEFGAWDEVVLHYGRPHARQEAPLLHLGGTDLTARFEREVSLGSLEPGYVRAEAHTVTGRLCLTNPVWIG